MTYTITITNSLWDDMGSAIESRETDMSNDPTYNPPGLRDMITAYYVAAGMQHHYVPPEHIDAYLAAIGGAAPRPLKSKARLVLPSLDAVRELREEVLYRTEFNAPRGSNRYGVRDPRPAVYRAGLRALAAIDEVLAQAAA